MGEGNAIADLPSGRSQNHLKPFESILQIGRALLGKSFGG
jgi:hypothetical protein